jgi:hypothetical protein
MNIPYALLLSILLCAPAFAGDIVPLGEKTFSADVIIELRLVFDRQIPRNWPIKSYAPLGRGFPDALIARATQGATIIQIIKGDSSITRKDLPRNIFVFSSGSPCWWRAHKDKAMRTMLFFRKSGTGAYRQIFGVEYETGQYSDVNPRYHDLVAAVRSALEWREERMRAVPVSQLWPAQRSILRSSANPYEIDLAVWFLRNHQSADVVGEMWNGSGSELYRRKEKELRTELSRKVCGK